MVLIYNTFMQSLPFPVIRSSHNHNFYHSATIMHCVCVQATSRYTSSYWKAVNMGSLTHSAIIVPSAYTEAKTAEKQSFILLHPLPKRGTVASYGPVLASQSCVCVSPCHRPPCLQLLNAWIRAVGGTCAMTSVHVARMEARLTLTDTSAQLLTWNWKGSLTTSQQGLNECC